MKHQIKHRYIDAVLFECELPNDTPSGLATHHALEKAVANKAYLRGANLSGAYLSEANLSGANLRGACLSGACLSGAKLIGDRPWFQLGPIGSRCDYFTAWITDQGLKLQAGCFFGTVEEFISKLNTTHQNNNHAKEYQMALLMIEAHAALWTPETP